MNYNSLLDAKNQAIKNKLIKLELKLKTLNSTKNKIELKIGNQSQQYDDIILSINKDIKEKENQIKTLRDKIEKYKLENIEIEKIKKSELEKELLIYHNEKNRYNQKVKDIKSSFEEELNNTNNLICILKDNNKDIKECMEFTTSKNKSYITDKYSTRQSYKNTIDDFKKHNKIKNKTVLSYKKKITLIENKVTHLYNQLNLNIENRNQASSINYELCDKLKNLKELLNEKEKNIQTILKSNLKSPIQYSNNSYENKFNRNETSLIKIVKEKDEIKNKIAILINTPEYNIKNYYDTIDIQNNKLLKEIDILTNNKKQFQNKLDNPEIIEKKNENKAAKSDHSAFNNHKVITNNNNFLKKLNTRLKKNTSNLEFLNNEIVQINAFYSTQLETQNIYNARSENRLQISKQRTNKKYSDKTKNVNKSISDFYNTISSSKKEINELLIKKKIFIQKKKELLNNNNPYIKNINYEIKSLNDKISVLNKTLR